MPNPKAGPIAADRLKSYIERIERLREEKKAIGGDERDVFLEAKGVGYDTKAMREVLKRRAMDAAERDDWDNLVDTYEHALGLRGEAVRAVMAGATYEEAADQSGLSRATVARAVASRKNLENDTPESAAGTGSATVVATGNLDALSPNPAGHVVDNSTTDDGLEIPAFLRRGRG